MKSLRKMRILINYYSEFCIFIVVIFFTGCLRNVKSDVRSLDRLHTDSSLIIIDRLLDIIDLNEFDYLLSDKVFYSQFYSPHAEKKIYLLEANLVAYKRILSQIENYKSYSELTTNNIKLINDSLFMYKEFCKSIIKRAHSDNDIKTIDEIWNKIPVNIENSPGINLTRLSVKLKCLYFFTNGLLIQDIGCMNNLMPYPHTTCEIKKINNNSFQFYVGKNYIEECEKLEIKIDSIYPPFKNIKNVKFIPTIHPSIFKLNIHRNIEYIDGEINLYKGIRPIKYKFQYKE